ncbi:Uncharacterised protein [Actinobacillus pleuropneumoniae]|uniref:Uncharacterized protein n=1 Tax=Actinobacillus equuli TaxID=718 RepID=A0AAX3FGK7_ACTEU|nr:Uncharacterised protein [Actinobacillus pleuropneumoniae]VEE89249.1 Uncharacterised protein [Actinobacillus equuli]
MIVNVKMIFSVEVDGEAFIQHHLLKIHSNEILIK